MNDSDVIVDVYGNKERSVSEVFSKVFGWMFGGLLVTGLTAFYTAHTPWLLERIFTNNIYWIGLLIAELVLVITLTGRVHKMSKGAAITSFMLYSVVNGLTLSVIFLAYTLSSIASVFFISAGMFGIMALYGYTTKKDLSKLGSILLMALIGIILAGIVNLFLSSSALSFAIAVVAVIVFVGLTAYDVQKIKAMAYQVENDDEFMAKFAILGALTLYLDFINLFLELLRIFGKSRD